MQIQPAFPQRRYALAAALAALVLAASWLLAPLALDGGTWIQSKDTRATCPAATDGPVSQRAIAIQPPRELPPQAPTRHVAAIDTRKAGELQIRVVGPGFALADDDWIDRPIRLEGLTGEATGSRTRQTLNQDLTASWSSLPSGRYVAHLAGMDPAYVTVQPNEIQEYTWHAPSMSRVEGLVLLESGEPLASAGVWVSHAESASQGEVLAQTDEDGYFQTLVDLSSQRWIGAISDGMSMSPLQRMAVHPAGTASRCSYELRIEEPSLPIEGVVVNQNDQPVSGAQVQLRALTSGLSRCRGAATRSMTFPSPVMVTGSSGEFQFPHPRGMAFEIHVDHPDHAPGHFSPARGYSLGDVIVVRLSGARQVEGIVRDRNQDPIRDAMIVLRGRGSGAPQITRTSADGKYKVANVTTKPTEVSVQKSGYKAQVISLTQGDEPENFDVQLELIGDRWIQGTVVPAAPPGERGWAVSLKGRDASQNTFALGGSFRLRWSDEAQVVATVRAEESGDAAAFHGPVQISEDGRLTIRLPDHASTRMTVFGTIIHGPEVPIRGTTVRLRAAGGTDAIHAAIHRESGAFEATLPKAGYWWIDIHHEGRRLLTRSLGGLHVAPPGEATDLGIIDLTARGHIELVGPDGGFPTHVQSAKVLATTGAPAEALDPSRPAADLPAGSWLLMCRGHDGTNWMVPFHLEDGGQARLDCEPPSKDGRGVVDLSGLDHLAGHQITLERLADQGRAGELVWSRPVRPRSTLPRLELESGRYALRALRYGALADSWTLTLDPGQTVSPQPTAVTCALKTD